MAEWRSGGMAEWQNGHPPLGAFVEGGVEEEHRAFWPHQVLPHQRVHAHSQHCHVTRAKKVNGQKSTFYGPRPGGGEGVRGAP